MQTPLFTTTVETPIGSVVLVASDIGLRALLFGDDDEAMRNRHHLNGAKQRDDHPVLVTAASQLTEYFAGERQDFEVPLDMVGTDFQREAWKALQSIPYGSTVSYGEQARRIGKPRAVRAIGAANGRNPVGVIVPCHRVVGADGSLTGYGGGLPTKAWLLDHERDVLARS